MYNDISLSNQIYVNVVGCIRRKELGDRAEAKGTVTFAGKKKSDLQCRVSLAGKTCMHSSWCEKTTRMLK